MQNKYFNKSHQGFTLIELLIVTSVLAVLMAIAVFTYPASQKRARDTQRLSDLNQYKTALATYASYRDGKFPIRVTTTSIDDLCEELEVPDCPMDPKETQDYLYQTNASGTQFVAWLTKESEKDVSKRRWAVCSNGNSGILNSTPSGGNCDITIQTQPDPVNTATPNPTEPTNTPTPASSATPTPPSRSTPTPTPVGQPRSPNLVLNSSFEQDKQSWNLNTDGSVSFRVISGGTDGAYMAQINKTANDDTNTQFFQTNLNVKPNTNYQLSLDAKSDNGNADFSISLIKDVSPFSNYGLSSYNVSTTTSWKSFSTSFQTNASASGDARLRFFFRSTQISKTHLDNIVLREI